VSGSIHSPEHSRNVGAGPALVTLLAVQIVIGYEWLASGVTKIASGTFASGLAADLRDNSQDAWHGYRSFLSSSIIPNARAFAVLIEVGEVIVGLGFILAAIVWLARWSRLSDRWRMLLLWATMLSALGATFMAVNFHLASGANHPWLIPADGFDETIDVDTVLACIQTGFFIFSAYLLLKIRREGRAANTVPAQLSDDRSGQRAPQATSEPLPARVTSSAGSSRDASARGAGRLGSDRGWRRFLFAGVIGTAVLGAVGRLVKR